jgi:hypothetical protein
MRRALFIAMAACSSPLVPDSPASDPPAEAAGSATVGTEPSPGSSTPRSAEPVDLRLVFVHGVLSDDSGRLNAENELGDLEKGVVERINARGGNVRLATARVNLYSDDNKTLLSPGIDDRKDGKGLASAKAWREQLVAKTNKVFPAMNNIVFIGHSTGARVSAEVTADPAWGLQDRVAGVVTLHGMIDALNSDAYNFIGPTSFLTGCKFAQGDGWCEYAALVSGVAALDWVARERHVLSLIGAGDCSTALWAGESDKSLPLRAESSPWSPGMTLTAAPGDTLAPAHGTFYGRFCHSDPTSHSSPRHADSIAAASTAITTWLFDAAPRVVASTDPNKPAEVAALSAGVASSPIAFGATCPADSQPAPKPDVAAVCRHPGLTDGDDHAFAATNQIDLAPATTCDRSVRVSHKHAGEQHAMRVWTKSYALPSGGGLLSTLR